MVQAVRSVGRSIAVVGEMSVSLSLSVCLCVRHPVAVIAGRREREACLHPPQGVSVVRINAEAAVAVAQSPSKVDNCDVIILIIFVHFNTSKG